MVHDMEIFLINISSKRKPKQLSQKIIDSAKMHIEDVIKSSTRYYFEENEFYHELPTPIRNKLIKNVLYHDLKKFKYFFHDFTTRARAPDDFMIRVITNLDS